VVDDGADCVVAGGVESISFGGGGGGNRENNDPRLLQMYPDIHMPMIDTADVVAKRYNVSRESQDEFSLESQRRMAAAQQGGKFKDEIVPMKTKMKQVNRETKEETVVDYTVDRDECNRPDTTLEGLLKLPPVFDAASGLGSVTAGNSSQLSDGASATLLMSAARAEALGIRPTLVYRGYTVAACEPDEMGIGPVYAVPALLRRHGLHAHDIALWELNEAFASQVIYCRDTLGIPMDRLNVNGGSIAIGHPFGMTGSRLVGTLASAMLARKARYGVVTMCVGGGQGAAALFEAWG
jgi:acetyl-CoA C-acetyltransferase